MGVDVLGLIIFGICILLFIWDKIPMATTAILGCVLMVVFDVCEFKDAFGSFSSSTVILTMGVMIIGSALSATGAAKKIGELIEKITNSNERIVIGVSYFVAALLSAFLTNSAVMAMFIPIVAGMGSSNKSIKAKNIVMPICVGCGVGGISTLVGSTQQMTAQGLLEENGYQIFKVFDFTPFGLILFAMGLIYVLFIGYPIGKKIWGNRADDEIVVPQYNSDKNGRIKLIIMAVIMLIMIVLYVTEWIPIAVTASACAILCILTGCISQKEAVSHINWNVVGRLAGCLGLAKAITVSGGTDLIATWFAKIGGTQLSPWMLFAIAVLFTQAASEFISNSTAILMVMPIILTTASVMGLNVTTYALGIAFASSMVMACPLSGSTPGIAMTAGYTFNDFFKYGILYDILCYILIIVFIPMMYGLTV